MSALIDLAEARRTIVQTVAANDGNKLVDEQLNVARLLAAHLARRNGRDAVATGEALVEAAASLAGLAQELKFIDEPAALVLLNVLGMCGAELMGGGA